MRTLLLIGGGGHCRAAIDVIEAEDRFQIKGIVQHKSDGTEPVMGYSILGEDADMPRILDETDLAFVTVGQIRTPSVRIRLYEQLKRSKTEVPIIVSPKAYVSRYAHIDAGTLVMHGAIVNAGARVGCNVIINSMALIEHDATIGSHCHVSTGARINGGVFVEDGCFIGSGAVLREGVRIGANSVIGANSFVGRNIEPNTLLKTPQ